MFVVSSVKRSVKFIHRATPELLRRILFFSDSWGKGSCCVCKRWKGPDSSRGYAIRNIFPVFVVDDSGSVCCPLKQSVAFGQNASSTRQVAGGGGGGVVVGEGCTCFAAAMAQSRSKRVQQRGAKYTGILLIRHPTGHTINTTSCCSDSVTQTKQHLPFLPR